MSRGRVIEVESDRPLPYQVDGDSAGTTPVTFRVLPSAARIMVHEGTPE